MQGAGKKVYGELKEKKWTTGYLQLFKKGFGRRGRRKRKENHLKTEKEKGNDGKAEFQNHIPRTKPGKS